MLQQNELNIVPLGLGGAGAALLGNIAAIKTLAKELRAAEDIPLWKARLIEFVESRRAGIPRATITRTLLPVAAAYNPATRELFYSKVPTFFHELGHHLMSRKLLSRLSLISRALNLPLGLYTGAAYATTGEAKYPVVAAAAALPALTEETLAHIKGYRVARRWRRGLLRLIAPEFRATAALRTAFPALASYLTSMALPFFVGALFAGMGEKI